MVIIVQIIGLIAVAFLFYYSYRLLEKDHLGKSSTFALIGVVILFCCFPWFQGFVKSWISARIDARLAALGQQVNDVQATTEAMQKELSEHQVRIDEHQKQLDGTQSKFMETEGQISSEQTGLSNQFKQLSILQARLDSAQTNILNQEEQIQNVQFLVDNIYSKMVEEDISGADTNNLFVIARTNGPPLVLFRLKHIPVANSIHAVAESSTGQFPLVNMNRNTKNILGTFWLNGDARANTYNFEYVSDSRATNVMTDDEIRAFISGLQSVFK
jgi:hypothetical protein